MNRLLTVTRPPAPGAAAQPVTLRLADGVPQFIGAYGVGFNNGADVVNRYGARRKQPRRVVNQPVIEGGDILERSLTWGTTLPQREDLGLTVAGHQRTRFHGVLPL